MKKFLMVLFVILGVLTGCSGGNDSDYINTVKSMNTNNNEKIEDLVNKLLRRSEFYSLNKNFLSFDEHQTPMIVLSYQIAPNEMFSQLKNVNPILLKLKNLNWEIEGKTKKGKVIAVSTDLVLVKIPTEQDGDYIKLNTEEIEIYNKKDNIKISFDITDVAMIYLDVLDRYGYKPIVKEEIIEDKLQYDEVEFYPNGRIKYISDGPEEWDFEDKPIDFKSLEKGINDITKEIKEYEATEEDKGEHFSWQLSYLRLELEGLSLSKNLTLEEKEKLNNLIKTLEKTHTDAQRLWAN